MNSNLIRDGQGFSLVRFFKGYALYFNPTFRGGYNSIRTLIIVVMMFFFMSFVTLLPFEARALLSSSELYNAIMSDNVTYEQIYDLLMNNHTIQKGMIIAINAGGISASLIFADLILHSSTNMSAQLGRKLTQPMMVNKQFAPYQNMLFLKTFYKEYVKIMFIPLVTYVLGYFAGFFLHYYLIGHDPFSIAAFSMMVGVVFLIPIFPLLGIFMDNIVRYHKNTYNICYAKSVIYKLRGVESAPLSEQDKAMLLKMRADAQALIDTTKPD